MASIATELKTIRQQVERLQAEAAGRQQLSSRTIWDEQNNDSVNQIGDHYNGLIIHLTAEVTPAMGTLKSGNTQAKMSQNEFNDLRRQIIESLDTPVTSALA